MLQAARPQRPMFWNLVVVHYERYSLHHLMLFAVLLLYSYLGAVVICELEGKPEDIRIHESNKAKFQTSVLAKKVLIDKIQTMYFHDKNFTKFYETELRIALDRYDVLMEAKPLLVEQKKWTMWGGLYYVGTIYTTIGYGDLAAETVEGRVFTVLYAMIGIPMVITILNDWGTMLFKIVSWLWSKKRACLCCFSKRERKKNPSEENLCELGVTPPPPEPKDQQQQQKEEPIPFSLVFLVLFIWMTMCASIFCYFEGWSFGKSIYFFLISLTTIGFGDIVPDHKTAVFSFLLILCGLSFVSMFINAVQQQLELLFTQIVKSIENDFKNNLGTGAEEDKGIASVSADGKVEMSPTTTHQKDGDAVKQFSKDMSNSSKLLMRFMSNHQRQMLNEKYEGCAKMRNKWTQTATQIKVASVQTSLKDDPIQYEDSEEEDGNQPQKKGRINARRLYIYNTGE